jgi:hypothetical protein
MKKTAATGAILATAVAMMFVANTSFAQEASPSSSQSANVRCLGANDCKGLSACKTAAGEVGNYPASAGPKQNSCKGQGMTYTDTAEQCTAKGGKVGKALTM